ncbi:Multi-sensor Hybrid Histidine Kinase [Fulvivirga imtechensis AK7]|uniref:histidine kinase n=2 Tax=Fulvivirga TaxID=396811 RepID=L8JM12_9BACT|nr:Multi-sensor Hybrid Histidine Kinase [Fulvivirga imtechensis AK7]
MRLVGQGRDIIGKPVAEALPEIKNQGFIELLDCVYSTGEPYIGNETLLRVDKHGNGIMQDVYVNFIYQPLKNAKGEVTGIFAQGVDVTETVKARLQIQENEQFLNRLVSNLPGSVYRCEPESPWKTTYMSEGAYELTGYRPDEFTSDEVRWISIIYPEDLDYVISRTKEGITNREIFTLTYRIVTKSGALKWVWDRGVATYNENGEAVFIEGFTTDITERKTAEIEKQKLVAIIDATTDFVGLSTVDGDAMYINPAGLKILGWENIENQKILDCIYPEDRALARDVLLPSLFEKGHFRHEIRFLNEKTGDPVWMIWNGTSVRDPDTGKIIALAAICSDISGLREAKLALEISEKRLKKELDGMKQLHKLVSRLLACPDLQTALNEVLSATLQIVGANMGNIQLYDEQDQCLKIVAHIGFNDDFLEYFGEVTFGDDSACSMAMKRLTREIIEDVHLAPSFKKHLKIAESAGYRAVQSTPLLSRKGQLLGMLSTHYRQPCRPSERELRILDLYARQAADFIELFRSGEALRKSELRFKTYAEAMPQMAFVADAQGNIIYYNQRWYDYVGKMEGTEGWGWVDKPIHHPDDLQLTLHRWQESLHTGKPYEMEYRLCRHDGEYRWHLGRAVPMHDSFGNIEMWLGTNTDIHAQKQAVDALRKSEEYYKTMTDNTPVITWITRPDGHCSYLNKQWYEYSGQTPATGLGFGWLEVVHPDDYERTKYIFLDAGKKKIPFSMEYRLRQKDGRYKWHLVTGLPKFDDQKKFEGHIGAVIDIHERKMMEEKLQESEEFSRTLFESSPDSVKALDMDGRLLSINTRGKEMFLIDDPDGYKGVHWLDLWKGDYFAEALKAITKAQTGEVGHFRGIRENPKGEQRWWDVLVAPVYGPGEKVERLVSVSRDITKLKELEQQKDDFIGIASHELKTPVTSIKAYTQVLHSKFDQANDRQSADMLGKMDIQINKLTGLISDLLDVTKIEQGKMIFRKEHFEFHELVEEIVEEVQRTACNHEIITELAESKIVAYGDRDRIGQVITNYLTNAIKYSPRADKVVLSTSAGIRELVLSVRDFGLGLTREDHEKVFERFYRVGGKGYETYPGLGLGLYISSEIIKRHQGQVSVESRKGEGATFYFSLPLPQ